MATRLYVGNIPFTATRQDFEDFFAPFELLDVQIVHDRDTGRSRGFGFVDVADPETARKAIAEFNGMDMGGRRVVVNEANSKTGGRGERVRR